MSFSASKAPFTRECNRSVPSSFQFLERKNRLFTRERNNCVSVLVSVPFHSFFFSPCHFSQQQLLPRMRLGKNLFKIVSFFGPVLHLIAYSHGNGTERNDCISFHFWYHFFIVPLFGTERCYFKRSRVNATPERSPFRKGNNMKRDDCAPL